MLKKRLMRSSTAVLMTACIMFSSAGTAMAATAQAAKDSKADLILLNGNIHVFDNKLSIVQALAVKDGKIVQTGKNASVKELAGASTKVVDLQGKLVLPAFSDSHAHASAMAEALYTVNLNGLGSSEKYVQAVKEFAEKNPGITVIQGNGWSNTVFPPTGPVKEELDKISTSAAIAIYSEDHHSLWVNSKALELGGITKDTPDPAAGRIEKNADGTPSGTLRETAANLVSDKLADFTVEQYENAILAYQDMVSSYGTTLAWDPMPADNAITAYKNLAEAGKLKMRIRAGYRMNPDDNFADKLKELTAKKSEDKVSDLFAINSIKLFTDGVIEGTTAYLNQPYEAAAGKPAGFKGDPIYKQDALNSLTAMANKAGFSVHMHAIGDAACTQALDAFAYSEKLNGKHDYRNAITHLQLVNPTDFKRFKQLAVVAVPDPYWAMKDDYYYNLQLPFLGQKRADSEYPMESFFKLGVTVASASDFPVTDPPNSLTGIQIGVTRTCPAEAVAQYGGDAKFKQPLWPAERATLDQMISSYTTGGAYANFLDKVTGSLEKNKSADFIILDKNIYKLSADKIETAKVVDTYFEGQQVYSAQ